MQLFYHLCVNLASIKSQPCYIFSRYASLYFCLAIENQENELLALEVIHRYVELLDKYFGNVRKNAIRFLFADRAVVSVSFTFCFCISSQVCELDIIFNFEKAYFILDEFLMGGEIQETSKQMVNRSIEASDMLQEVICTRTLLYNTTQNAARHLRTCERTTM